MTGRHLMALAGFWIFALSPSFIDIQQEREDGNDGRAWQIVAYYIVATIFVWFGLFSEGRKA